MQIFRCHHIPFCLIWVCTVNLPTRPLDKVITICVVLSFCVLHSLVQGLKVVVLLWTSLNIKFRPNTPMNLVMAECLCRIWAHLRSVSFPHFGRCNIYRLPRRRRINQLPEPTRPNYALVRERTRDGLKCTSLQRTESQFGQIACRLQMRQVHESRVFVVQTATMSGSIDLPARSQHNQSPSQRLRHPCSAALQSYLCLITSQRACHLSVLWHLNSIYTPPTCKMELDLLLLR